MSTVLVYVTTLTIFVVVDLVWLGAIAKSFYRRQIGPLLKQPFSLPAILAFYLIYAAGLVVFAVRPALDTGTWIHAARDGALLGAVCYATYDLTNLATLRGWSAVLSIVDMAWGKVLSALTAAAACAICYSIGVSV